MVWRQRSKGHSHQLGDSKDGWQPSEQRERPGIGSPSEPPKAPVHTWILDFWPPQLGDNEFMLRSW